MSAKLRYTLAQLEWDKSDKDFSRVEQKVEVSNEIFEKCLSDMPEHHKITSRKRGFLRANATPFFFISERGMLYRHAITNIINKDAEINRIYTAIVNLSELSNKISELKSEGMRIVEIYNNSNKLTISFTKQRYIFD